MAIPIFKVGDLVRVREDLSEGDGEKEYNGVSFVSDMKQYRGKIYEIGRISEISFTRVSYFLKDKEGYLGGECGWFFEQSMLEPICKEVKINNEIYV